MLLILQHVCFVSAPHLCQDTVLSMSSTVVRLPFSFMQLREVKCTRSVKKKAWSPGQFWALGMTRNIQFTLRGLTARLVKNLYKQKWW